MSTMLGHPINEVSFGQPQLNLLTWLFLWCAAARIKFDYMLGPVVPASLKQCISMALLHKYCPKETVCHSKC